MCRLLRRHLVTVRKPRVCPTCGRPIASGEQAVKTEYAERLAGSSRETIRCEYDCCQVNRVRAVRWWTGHNVWSGRHRPTYAEIAAKFRIVA